MSSANTGVWSDFQRKNGYYPDGITKITDPFWRNACRECGKIYLSSSVCDRPCPACGSMEIDRRLGGMTRDQAAARPKSTGEDQA
ncbi:MAG: hydrogenase maturation nickel metallochaperone HypA [Lachnospiraceae bacterium]|nr:hydrogenase maturation nickel metallochaperone HypA [Lachnospiraceae bacterium]